MQNNYLCVHLFHFFDQFTISLDEHGDWAGLFVAHGGRLWVNFFRYAPIRLKIGYLSEDNSPACDIEAGFVTFGGNSRF
jgi:hypothetical protein